MNIKELKKLDIWIAKYVMSWHIKKNPQVSASDGRTYYDPDFGLKIRWIDDYGQQKVIFNPSEDAADAMKVLKKCCEKVVPSINMKDKEVWILHQDCQAHAPTLELAICLFAKKLFSMKPKKFVGDSDHEKDDRIL